ncbi:MAG: hypothetical protein H6657_01945 [Ardenticatenaceae bacterium]|nr:hypothetical protein [Ardenticatenaceae bacterium]
MIKQRFLILFLLLMAGLAACTGTTFSEPTPIPPPPTNDSDTNPPVAATNTPDPIAEATDTAVDPTPTLIATATPTAEIVATAVTNPPVQVVNSQPLPASSRNLLFLADGAFKQWNHATSQVETIVPGPNPASRVPEDDIWPAEGFVGDVTAFSMSADGKRAVVARLLNKQASSPELGSLVETSQELLFVDMISGEMWTLVPQVDNLGDFQLSPDAQQLAFTGTGLDGIPDAGTNPPDADSGVPLPNNLYVMSTGGGNPGPVRLVRDCTSRCLWPVWHGESNLVAFTDNEALWLYNIAANEPEILLVNTPFYSGMADVSQISIYSPIAWAKNGRYLLLWNGGWESASRAVLDVPTKAFAAIPNSLVYADPFPSEISWMPDDRLLIWRTEHTNNSIVPLAELWRFNPANEELVKEESTVLSTLPLGVLGGTTLENGRFAFALNSSPADLDNETAVAAAGTYQLVSLAETPERVNTLPPSEAASWQSQVYWAKDGSGAILVQQPRQFETTVFYAPTDGDFLYEITAVLGQNAHAFQWQPEIIVP